MTKKYKIEDMQKLAKAKNGKCLSNEYQHIKAKLRWKCKEGHEWEATPDNIKRGTWCPICGIRKRADSQRLTIDEMRKIANQRGGLCLSDKYINTITPLKWKCKGGHEWEASPNNIKRGSWCPYCSHHVKLAIEEMQKIAKERNGECLSKEYINIDTKLRWRCKEGHEWEATPYHIKNREQWCPHCAGKVKLTIENMQEIAKERGGECLSKEYINSKTKLRWRCKEGHTWDASPNNIKWGTWCPDCGEKRKAESLGLTIAEMQEIAKSRGGECLSKEYINAHIKLRWRCKEGHEWEARPNDIKTGGTWCPICARKKGWKKYTIEDMRKLAQIRGGQCLSNEYIHVKSKLRWRCKLGHEWENTPDHILANQWCPICASGISERICRKYFEIIFNANFPKAKPKWLRNTKGNLMELDGYCKKLGIAFEYQGQQHFRSVNLYDGNMDLDQRKEYDEQKRKLCKLHNVHLIEVPYYVDFENMGAFIIKMCKNEGIEVPKITRNLNYKFFNIYSPEKLAEMQEMAKFKGGVCLSKKYINDRTKLKWQCKEGHVWDTTPNNIKRGTWCPYCARVAKKTLEDMQKIAISKGGKCLSSEYIDSKTKLKWQCEKGHVWEATSGHISQGKWCPFCIGRGKTIVDMQKLAETMNGKCISIQFKGMKTKLKWQCKYGHIWEAKPSNIMNGSWCPYCAGNARKNIEFIQKLAESKGGKCLSTNYMNAQTKLRLVCGNGHEWKTKAKNILKGRWCPHCAGNIRKTIEDMQNIAKSRNGKCLSREYINDGTKLEWQCSKGHAWEAIPSNIKQGKWCPYCAGKMK